MRKTKFRGRCPDNGAWICGDLLHIAGGCLIYFGNETNTEEPDIDETNPIAVELYRDETAVVEPATVGQFTGLHDKDGEEIFEGDILRMRVNNLVKICSVAWNEKVSAWCIAIAGPYYSLGTHSLGNWMAEGAEFEIVGNIHDNPKLI